MFKFSVETSKKKNEENTIKKDFAEIWGYYSKKRMNARGSKNFARLCPNSKFAKLCKKLFNAEWLGLSDEKKVEKMREKHDNELRYQCDRIVNELKDENGIITSENGMKFDVRGVNNVEFVRQFYNIIYCNDLLETREIKFRNACNPTMTQYFYNINFEGSYEIVGLSVEKGDVCVDVGGGYGLWAITSILAFGAKKVYVFEPNPKARQIILRNRELNGISKEQMPVYSFALGKKKFQGILYTKANTHCTGFVKIIDPDRVEVDKTHEMEKVQVISFDMFFNKIDEEQRSIQQETGYYQPPKIDFIKINTGGGTELDVIAGGSYYFTYVEKLPKIAVLINNYPDLYRDIQNRMSAFNGKYGYKVRLAKMNGSTSD